MASQRDYYEILGVDRSAGADEIRKRYRSLAQKHHPDRNPDDAGAAERFREVSEAYEVLSDPQKRQQYDRFGRSAPGEAPFGGGSGAPGDFGFGDLFNDMFNQGGGQQQGQDLQGRAEITLEEAAEGVTREYQVPVDSPCGTCSGSGAAPGSQVSACGQCGGSGQQQRQMGFMTISQTCGACRGQGRRIENPCSPCSGSGFVRENQGVKVHIPAGIQSGTRVRMPGKGQAGAPGAPVGDLYIEVEIKHHPIFERSDNHLFAGVEIDMVDAALGCEIQVKTLKDPIRIKVPPGSQDGEKLRIAGKGMPQLRTGNRGDLYYEVKVIVPKKLTDEQRTLLEQYRSLGE
ncbi:MAG: molecular chaperone DnaJ [Gammaproteobacteria bacterium AqS3]|nr:molecular chaperone DnaJ [Gammaproteobacteria bacterium AqS3]